MSELRLVHDIQVKSADVIARLSLPGLTLSGGQRLAPPYLELSRGETVALTGASGVGKTSLIRVLAGLETRHRGAVETPARLAMVFQEPTLLPWRTLRDNITLTTGVSLDAAEDALDEVGLHGRGGDFPRQLSLGQQRRMGLARAFAAGPALLLMDEPFVSLDEGLADEMMTLFETLRAARNVTTLIVTHAEREADRLADRILRLEGTPASLREDG